MASDTPDIEPFEGGGVAETVAVAAAVAAAAACVSCGATIVGAFCAGCGQKNDDMRRSSFVLAKDFVKDTFAFDGRMWRTLGLLAAAPGTVPARYSHGKRSRYTPPVRLFLVVSFLFFLILSLTHTLIVAIEVKARTPEETAAAEAAIAAGLKQAGAEASEAIAQARVEAEGDAGAIVIDNRDLDCELSANTRFFVRADEVDVDRALWARCRDSLMKGIKSEIEEGAEADPQRKAELAASLTVAERMIAGVTRAIEDPQAFNASLNNWLPRVMFLMAPVLALILALFLRRGALLFDHLVFSIYAHATAFAIIGLAVVAAQMRLPNVFAAASAALGLYLVIGLKRAYGRGWIKSVWTAVGTGFLYLIVLSLTVVGIIFNQLIRGA